MTADKIIVILVGIGSIAFTYWFFLMKKEKIMAVINNSVDIIVQGGYTPEVIQVQKGQKTTINFTRKDPSSCLEEVVLGDFKVRRQLPLNKTVIVEITPEKEGEYGFACGMNMFHGKIIVT